MNRTLKILGLVIGSLISILFVIALIIGSICPETWIYLEREIPSKYVEEIKELKLIDDDENIKYFYSDALWDIKDGMYFITDKKIVAYNSSWIEPETLIPFESIDTFEVEFSEEFLTDSYMYVLTKDDLEVSFPISNEKERDKLFYEYLEENVRVFKE